MTLVVQGSYDELFVQNPHLRDLATKAADDSHWVQAMAKLENDQEFVLKPLGHCYTLPFSFSKVGSSSADADRYQLLATVHYD